MQFDCYEWTNGTGIFWNEDSSGNVIPGSIHHRAQPLCQGQVLESYMYSRTILYKARAFIAGLCHSFGY